MGTGYAQPSLSKGGHLDSCCVPLFQAKKLRLRKVSWGVTGPCSVHPGIRQGIASLLMASLVVPTAWKLERPLSRLSKNTPCLTVLLTPPLRSSRSSLSLSFMFFVSLPPGTSAPGWPHRLCWDLPATSCQEAPASKSPAEPPLLGPPLSCTPETPAVA